MSFLDESTWINDIPWLITINPLVLINHSSSRVPVRRAKTTAATTSGLLGAHSLLKTRLLGQPRGVVDARQADPYIRKWWKWWLNSLYNISLIQTEFIQYIYSLIHHSFSQLFIHWVHVHCQSLGIKSLAFFHTNYSPKTKKVPKHGSSVYTTRWCPPCLYVVCLVAAPCASSTDPPETRKWLESPQTNLLADWVMLYH